MRLEIVDDNNARKAGVARYSEAAGPGGGGQSIRPSQMDRQAPGRPSVAGVILAKSDQRR